jgi:predicted DCC family thiol-disulfide oxidoreductase YuxK
MAQLPVLYDADCGFCRAVLGALLFADRGRRLRPISLQSDAARELLPDTTEAERLAALHVAPPGRRPLSGGAAVAEVLLTVPAGRPVGRLLGRTPRAVERGYRLVADNRSRLSRLVPRGAVERADSLIARRGA